MLIAKKTQKEIAFFLEVDPATISRDVGKLKAEAKTKGSKKLNVEMGVNE